MDKIRLRVPATSANLGSGFDCLGIAFQKYNVFDPVHLPEPVPLPAPNLPEHNPQATDGICL